MVTLGERPFALHVPRSYDPAEPAALVLALHGWGGTGEMFVDRLRLEPASENRGFLLAVPEGTTDRDGRQFWNATDACCDVYDSGVDDSAYLADVIGEVSAQYSVDPARVFVTGISNGGYMAHRMGCDHADLVAAVASFSGAQTADPGACAPSQAVSVLEVHGSADEDVLPQGGRGEGARYPSVRETVATWRRLDGCGARRGTVGAPLDADAALPGAETVRTSWTPCDQGSEVALWTVDGGGHVPEVTPALTAALVEWMGAHARPSG
jgi:polyhydroxybutyrate depolymerase